MAKDYSAPRTIKNYYRLSVLRQLLGKDDRIYICKHYKLHKLGLVHIKRPDVENPHSFYMGLMTCGLGWYCPVCSSKIMQRKKEECVNSTTGYMGGLGFGTLTLQHKKDNTLAESLDKLSIAYRNLHSGREWQNLINEYGIIGEVKAVDIRYGFNAGWHPHYHTLMYFKDYIDSSDIEELEKKIKNIYLRKLSYVDGYANDERGFQLKTVKSNADLVAEYVAKWDHEPHGGQWGVESEVVLSGKKVSGNSKNIFELVDMYDMGILDMGEKIKEFVETTKGRKQVGWSPNLRKKLGLGIEKTDIEIATEESSCNVFNLYEVTEIWDYIRKNRLQGQILHLVDTQPEIVGEVLKSIYEIVFPESSINIENEEKVGIS